MKYIATIWYWLVFIATAPAGIVMLALFRFITTPFDPLARWSHTLLSRWTHLYLKVWPLWRVRIIGAERLPSGPCVLIANHQSAMDVVACLGLPHSFKFVSKASLKDVPIVGQAMRLARYVFVDRGQLSSTRRMVEQSREWLQRGISLLIFPEGTYSGGEKLLPFKRGAFALAIAAQVPLVPIVLRGITDVVFEDGPWMGGRADVTITVLEPIAPADLGQDDAALASRMQKLYREQLEP